MPVSTDAKNALGILESIQTKVQKSEDPKLYGQIGNDLKTMISLLESPIFQGILNVKDSLNALKEQLIKHPSLLPEDFDISENGDLVLSVPTIPDIPEQFSDTFQVNAGNYHMQQTLKLEDPKLKDVSRPVSGTLLGSQPSQQDYSSTHDEPIEIHASINAPINTDNYEAEIEAAIGKAALGRDTHIIQLFKPEGSSLGFSVVGLKSEHRGELGIFVQDLQPDGIAARDGRLAEGDQILAIDGQPLDSNISHHQAISILQKAKGQIELIVARGSLLDTITSSNTAVTKPVTETAKVPESDMVLNTEWSQVEVIDLVNDGSGLGFGIIGGRSTGVVVKTIVPGGVADKDGRLQSGDHILQIGEVNLRGMGSEQVAAVLRQSGKHVRMVVARPVEPSSPEFLALGNQAPVVPTRILGDPEELERQLSMSTYQIQPQTNGYGDPSLFPVNNVNGFEDSFIYDPSAQNGVDVSADIPDPLPMLRISPRSSVVDDITNSVPSVVVPSTVLSSSFSQPPDALPEMETLDVEIAKDLNGLGITIAGYVCEREELSGIFVKSINEGSAADLCRKISVNDQIVEVDGISLQGFNNHQAVEVLRHTGQIVKLKLARYLRGPKFEQLQQAIANCDVQTCPPQATVVGEVDVTETVAIQDNIIVEARNEFVSLEKPIISQDPPIAIKEIPSQPEVVIDNDYVNPLKPVVETAIKESWGKVMGPEYDIVIAQLSKSPQGGGLGISLEGTVDVEDGKEVRPHHYIRSILPRGPVGMCGILLSGDELLEVNGTKLLGLNHVEVVSILKDLPQDVRIVCCRRNDDVQPVRFFNTRPDHVLASQPGLGGSLQNLSSPSERLVKAKSDGSLASSSTTATSDSSFNKIKSRSLEPLTGLAMWSSEPQIIELMKGERGLGFSILDYQDPINSNETVIVIRSLVPGGVAQQDGRLIPGDRLVSVNDVNLENASLDTAVQALKGAPKGIVKIGVAKPLPLPDSASHSQEHLSVSDLGVQRGGHLPSYALAARLPGDESKAEKDQDIPPPIPTSEPPLSDGEVEDRSSDEEDGDHSLVKPPTERLLPSYHHVTTMTSPSDLMEDGDFPNLISRLKTWEPPIPTLPKALERAVVIKKLYEQLGMHVEVVDNGVNGAVVRSISKIGCVHKDGRLQVGDYILSINNESLRKISNAQARAILRRAQLAGSEVSVTYIPGGDAAVHRESVLIQSKEELSRAIRNFPRLTTPSSPYVHRGDAVKKTLEKQIDSELQASDYREHPELQRSSTAPSFISKELKSAHSSQFSLTGPHSDTDSVNIEFVVKHGYSDTFATSIAPKRSIDFESDLNISSEVDLHTSKRASASSSVNELCSDISSFDSVDIPDGDESLRDLAYYPTSLRTDFSEESQIAFNRLPSLPEIPSSSSSSTPDKDVQTKSAPDLAVEVKTSPPPIAAKPVITKSPGTEAVSVPDLSIVLDSSSVDPCSSPCTYTSTTAISLSVPPAAAQVISDPTSDSSSSAKTTITQKSRPSSVMVGRSNSSTPVLTSSHWGPEKEVEVTRDPSRGLGISIVGGKVDLFQGSPNQGNAISGIFIKNVLSDSPAGKNGMLKTGDRILEVDGVDLRNASHERAVDVIRGAGNPVRFKVQSLVQWAKEDGSQGEGSPYQSKSPLGSPVSPRSPEQVITSGQDVSVEGPSSESNSPVMRNTPSPVIIQEGLVSRELAPPKSPMSGASSPCKSPQLDIEESDSSDDDSREGQGRTRSKAGFEIDRASAGNVRRSKAEMREDSEQEDDFGYTTNKINKKYMHLNGELVVVELDRGPTGLGLSLAGNKDRSKMSTFVVGIHPSGYAFKDGRIQVGDEILEVNGVVLHNRCHLNSSAIIRGLPGAALKFILLRRDNAVQEIAVKPITQFPIRLDDESPEEKYAKYKGLRVLTLKKGNQGLGIMIIEGKHAEAGQGIFISDIQEGSLAEQSGLQLGDMILAVNTEELVGADYDTATNILRRTEGVIRLVVSSPSKSKEDATTPSKDRAKTPEVKEPEKPKIPPKPVLSSLKSSSSAKNISLPVTLSSQPLIGSKSTPSLNTQSSTSPQIKAPSSTPGSLCKSKSIYSEEPPADPTTCPIVPGTETTIEITKEKMGLGLSIVGGKDTLLGSIIIHEVYPDGAAAKDQRLKPGDQILEVNSENFRDATHAKALAVLRQTPPKVKLVVYREEGLTKEEDLYDVFEVELFKKPGKGLGLSIVGRKNGPGVFVTEIVKGSVAEADNRLMQGDQILCVNGNDLKTATQEEAAAILKTTVGKTSLKIGRLKGGSRRPNSSANQSKPAGSEGSPDPLYRTVVLERGADGLGFTIVGGFGSPHGDLPIYVKTVFDKGAAAEHGGLERGDQIVAVDGRSLDGLTHQEAVAILKNVKTSVTLTVL